MERWILDRFEEDLAVFETESGFCNVPRSQLPANAAEGDCFFLCEHGPVFDAVYTAERRKKLAGRAERLFRNKKRK